MLSESLPADGAAVLKERLLIDKMVLCVSA